MLATRQMGYVMRPTEKPETSLFFDRRVPILERARVAGASLFFHPAHPRLPPELRSIPKDFFILILDTIKNQVRIVTSNPSVGKPDWIGYMCTGCYKVEAVLGVEEQLGRSHRRELCEALTRLQAAGVPTAAHLAPLFLTHADRLDALMDQLPLDGLDELYVDMWRTGSLVGPDNCVADLYFQVRGRAAVEGWLNKLVFCAQKSLVPEAWRDFVAGMGALLMNDPAPLPRAG